LAGTRAASHRRAQRYSDRAVKDEKRIADIAKNVGKKRADLAKTKSPATRRRLERQIVSLLGDQADAQRDLARHRKQAGTAQERLASAEAAEQAKRDRQRKRDERTLQRTLTSTASSMMALDQRLSDVERSLIERVREEIAAEPGERDHDVFLSYAGPDEDVARDLYIRLAERGLRV
jgi:hypothetical protein